MSAVNAQAATVPPAIRSAMSRKDISDELLTLLAAGHEITAATLGWAFERLSWQRTVTQSHISHLDMNQAG